MSGTTRSACLGALVVAVALWPAVGRADLGTAKRFYEEAKAEKSPVAQAQLLKKSIAAEPTFEAYLALGDLQLAEKQLPAARESLKKALDLAGNDNARARALYVTAETFLAEGQRRDAVALFRQSIRLHPYPNVVERLKAIELAALDTPVGADEIAGALTASATRSFSVAAASSIDLRIGFALNSAKLDERGVRQARELGRALAAPGLADRAVEIVGHTDKQGDAALNQKLSERRAEAVRAFLVREAKIPASRLAASGRGEEELLYPGDSESDHALNRRVEVKVQ